MDLATIIGLIGGMAFIGMAMILGGSLGLYVDVPSFFIVFVGSLFVVMMKFNLGQFLGAAKVAAKAFMFKLEKPE
ncbi:MAG: flagellar motor protein PomA, partial [Oceanisphaera sp.]|nr:flagellar motor protein PomA [Oceanisphaera sp.]